MKMKSLSFLIALLVAACGGDSKKSTMPEPAAEPAPAEPVAEAPAPAPEPAPAPAPEPPKPEPMQLALGEATVTNLKDKRAMWKLHADGTTEDASYAAKSKKPKWTKTKAVVKADGTVDVDGKTVMRFTTAGVTGPDDAAMPLKFEGDTIIASGTDGAQVTMALAADGTVTITGGNADGKSYKIDAKDPAVARTAFVVLGAGALGPVTMAPAPAPDAKK